MVRNRSLLYTLFCFALIFSSCKKDPVVGNEDYKTLGSSAHGLLAEAPYKLLQIELNYMPGYAPDSSSLNELVRFLSARINKSAGIQIIQHQIAPSGEAILNLGQVVALEKKNRSIFTGNDVIAVHILVADADYADVNVLGKSYWNTSIVLFGKTIKTVSGAIGQVSQSVLFTTLAEHEFGHLMGLVDVGSPMQTPHKDAANGTHCNNKNCLMYYAIETTATQTGIPLLDANCLADLKANGGK